MLNNVIAVGDCFCRINTNCPKGFSLVGFVASLPRLYPSGCPDATRGFTRAPLGVPPQTPPLIAGGARIQLQVGGPPGAGNTALGGGGLKSSRSPLGLASPFGLP